MRIINSFYTTQYSNYINIPNDQSSGDIEKQMHRAESAKCLIDCCDADMLTLTSQPYRGGLIKVYGLPEAVTVDAAVDYLQGVTSHIEDSKGMVQIYGIDNTGTIVEGLDGAQQTTVYFPMTGYAQVLIEYKNDNSDTVTGIWGQLTAD